MNTLKDLLDQAKAITGSDYKTAQSIGLSRQNVSHVRNGRQGLNDDNAFLLAELIDVNPSEVLAIVNANRTKNPEMKKRWEEWGKKVSSYAAGLLVVTPALLQQIVDFRTLYIM